MLIVCPDVLLVKPVSIRLRFLEVEARENAPHVQTVETGV